jgi:hypothetical protein
MVLKTQLLSRSLTYDGRLIHDKRNSTVTFLGLAYTQPGTLA